MNDTIKQEEVTLILYCSAKVAADVALYYSKLVSSRCGDQEQEDWAQEESELLQWRAIFIDCVRELPWTKVHARNPILRAIDRATCVVIEDKDGQPCKPKLNNREEFAKDNKLLPTFDEWMEDIVDGHSTHAGKTYPIYSGADFPTRYHHLWGHRGVGCKALEELVNAYRRKKANDRR